MTRKRSGACPTVVLTLAGGLFLAVGVGAASCHRRKNRRKRRFERWQEESTPRTKEATVLQERRQLGVWFKLGAGCLTRGFDDAVRRQKELPKRYRVDHMQGRRRVGISTGRRKPLSVNCMAGCCGESTCGRPAHWPIRKSCSRQCICRYCLPGWQWVSVYWLEQGWRAVMSKAGITAVGCCLRPLIQVSACTARADRARGGRSGQCPSSWAATDIQIKGCAVTGIELGEDGRRRWPSCSR